MGKRKQKTPAQKQKRLKWRYYFFRLLGRIAFVVTLIGAILYALTIFFKVNTITIEGVTRYSAEEIVAGMDIKKGNNLIRWDKYKTGELLLEQFPYLQSVKLRRRMPDGVIVSVTEGAATVAIPSNGGYYFISKDGKVLEQRPDANGLPIVTGTSLMGCVPGDLISQTNDPYASALLTILQALDVTNMLKEIDFINMQSLTDIRIGYMGRFDIRVETTDELAYRLRFATLVITERLSPSDIGRLNWDSKGRLHFVPESADEIAKSGGSTGTAIVTPVSPDTTTPSDAPSGDDSPLTDGENDDASSGDDSSDDTDSSDDSSDSYDDDSDGDDTDADYNDDEE